MNVRVLIDAIVHQTTILIAQLATTAGLRAPLAHVANQVFLDLVGELESQGVSRKVAADMFGMALRSYQQKVARLSESATDRGITLWQAVYQYLQEEEVASRADVLRRFRHDDVSSVKGILHDLVTNSLVYSSGRGDATLYRVMSEDDLDRIGQEDPIESAMALAWLIVYRQGPLPRTEILEQMSSEDDSAIDEALERLVDEGRIERLQDASDDQDAVYSSARCFIGLDDEAGWGAALFDHYQALVTALCVKLRNGETRALPDDRLGGSTFSFDVWENHPHADEAYDLLKKSRADLIDLWERVTQHNDAHAKPEDFDRVTFYIGQTLQAHGDSALGIDTEEP
jgi:predicted acetyltransferase